jgi:uncharacterized protein YjbI with pentapeptide repeats
VEHQAAACAASGIKGGTNARADLITPSRNEPKAAANALERFATTKSASRRYGRRRMLGGNGFARLKSDGLLAASANLKPSEIFNCQGFVFPAIDLSGVQFAGIADFRAAVFSGPAEFRGSTFHSQADFHTAQFLRSAGFFGVFFESVVRFLGVRFNGRAIFSGSKFFGTTTFHGCKFHDFTAFQSTKFDRPLTFHANEFYKDADFRSAVFYDGADFHETLFGNRLDFDGARFHSELRLSSTHIKLLKKLHCYRANLRGAILHTTQIWENDTLTNYDFRDAFLLSVNLSGKRILNSDFTGAVFRSVQ